MVTVSPMAAVIADSPLITGGSLGTLSVTESLHPETRSPQVAAIRKALDAVVILILSTIVRRCKIEKPGDAVETSVRPGKFLEILLSLTPNDGTFPSHNESACWMQTIESTLIHTIAPLSPDVERARPDAGHPVIILLHGRGATEDDLLGLSPSFDPRFLIIAVRAPLDFAYGGFTWYELQEIGTPEPAQFAESYDRLIRFLDDVRTHYPVDPQKMALVGFSMGAVMAYAGALTEPEKIHSIVAHSGYLPEHSGLVFRWNELRGKGFFVAHGVADPVIGVDFARRAKELLGRTEADLVYREYPISHSMSEESVMEFTQWLAMRVFGSAH